MLWDWGSGISTLLAEQSVARKWAATSLVLASVSIVRTAAQIQLPYACQGTPQQCGSWLPLNDWCAQLSAPTPPAGCQWGTIGHAALVPSGLHRGKVLLWHVMRGAQGGACEVTKKSFLFDPSNPAALIEIVHNPLETNIFCSGMGWDPDGNLIVIGGEDIDPGEEFPKQAYRFVPTALGSVTSGSPPTVTGRCWVKAGTMGIKRNYPTVVTFSRRPFDPAAANCDSALPPRGGGGAFAIGGRVAHAEANEVWDYLTVGAAAWSCAMRPALPTDYPAHASPSDPFYFLDHASALPLLHGTYAPSKAAGAPPSAYPEVDLESYPRAFQISTGEVVVTGDRDKLGTTLAGAANSAGHVWIVKPHYPGLTQGNSWELWRGPTSLLNLDRQWDSAVVMYMQNGPTESTDRILVFGGQDESPLTPSSGPLDSVEEYVHAQSAWLSRQAMVFPRWEHSTVILPTGVIFLQGGESPHEEGSIFTPYLYDPGRTPFASQAPPLPMSEPNYVPAGSCHSTTSGWTPRIQHHVALLLPDASVFVAGSDDVDGYPQGQFTSEVFLPPYLHYGFRPTITSAPAAATFSSTASGIQTFVTRVQLSDAVNSIERVVLLRPGAVTHQFDNDQRYIELGFTSQPVSGDPLSLDLTVASPSENYGPPGYYMLFAIEKRTADQKLAPSVATFVDFN
jgi:Domain of unknown function (DUF1929)